MPTKRKNNATPETASPLRINNLAFLISSISFLEIKALSVAIEEGLPQIAFYKLKNRLIKR